MYRNDVWRAFCELWGPLTNTLHHGGGEMGISLNDLKQIGGLPILGEAYEEFLPPNEQMSKFPDTVSELLRLLADLCKHLKVREVSWRSWLAYFYRGEQSYGAFGDSYESHEKKKSVKEDEPLPPLNVSKSGGWAAFLVLLLC